MRREVSGIMLLLVGALSLLLGFFSAVFAWYGIAIMILGIIVLLNTGEDKIESIHSARLHVKGGTK